jgi:hypothetical protein
MNMKKTIAAAAAGAMAVSATAASASAATTTAASPIQESGKFSYSLIKGFAKAQVGSATVTSERTISNITDVTAIYINIADVPTTNAVLATYAMPTGKGVINVVNDDADNPSNLYIQSTDDASTLISRSLILIGDKRNVALDETTPRDGMRLLYDSGLLQGKDLTTSSYAAKYPNALSEGDQPDYLVIDGSVLSARASNILVKYTTKIEHYYDNDGTGDLISDLSNALTTSDTLGIDGISAIATDATTVAGAAAGTITFNTTYKNVTQFVKYDPQGKTTTAPLLSTTNTTSFAGGVPNVISYLEGRDSTSGDYWYDQGTSNTFPVMNTPASNSVRQWQYIGRNSKYESGGAQKAQDYVNVMAVLNDTVANYDVVFTFNTATGKVMQAGNADITADRPAGSINADKGKSYAMFPQNLSGYFANDGTYAPYGTAPSTFFDYAASQNVNYSLFQGGLIINDYYSMQLADTEMFSYTATSLSFNFNTVKANAMANYNNWMTYIQSIRLATSQEWYWESLDIAWSTPVVETAESGEGLTSDEVGLEDEVPAEAPAEGEVVAVPEEETPVAPVENPPTGNSAVALAVIPVALAAAAIVAKKRK